MRNIIPAIAAVLAFASAHAGVMITTTPPVTYTQTTLPATVTLPDIEVAFTFSPYNFLVNDPVLIQIQGGTPILGGSALCGNNVTMGLLNTDSATWYFRVTGVPVQPFSSVSCTFSGLSITGASLQASSQALGGYYTYEMVGGTPYTLDSQAVGTVLANYEGPASVPEPGTLVLLGLGLACLGFTRRRKPR